MELNYKNLFGIIQGDSDVVLPQLIKQGVKYDLILTDPPYNLHKDFGNQSDCLSIDDFILKIQQRAVLFKKLLNPYGSIIWFGIHSNIGYIQLALYKAGLFYRRMNIWHYENGFSRSCKEPATHYEPFLWFSNHPKIWIYNVDAVRVPYKSQKRLKNVITYKKSDGTNTVWKPNPKGAMRGDVWDFPTLAGNRFRKERTEHPTQKPVSLITELIKAFCPMDDNGKYCGSILDPFHGSGTLGVCCEQLNLQQGNNIMWTGIELENKWNQIARQRLLEINGKSFYYRGCE